MEAVRIAMAINPLVMVTDDPRDLSIIRHFSENALANDWVLLHMATLLQGERTRLLEKTRG